MAKFLRQFIHFNSGYKPFEKCPRCLGSRDSGNRRIGKGNRSRINEKRRVDHLKVRCDTRVHLGFHPLFNNNFKVRRKSHWGIFTIFTTSSWKQNQNKTFHLDVRGGIIKGLRLLSDYCQSVNQVQIKNNAHETGPIKALITT